MNLFLTTISYTRKSNGFVYISRRLISTEMQLILSFLKLNERSLPDGGDLKKPLAAHQMFRIQIKIHYQ
jgi:hypothetical protein